MTLWLGAFSCWWWSYKLVALFFHLVPFNRCFKSSQLFALLLFLTKASLMLLTVVKWSRQLNPRYCKLVPFIPRTESILPNTKILGIASRGWRMNHWCAFPSVVIIGLFFLFYLRRRLLLGRQRGCLNQNLGANSIDFWWRIGLQLRPFLVITLALDIKEPAEPLEETVCE